MADYGKNTIGVSNEAISANNKRFCKFTSPADIGDVDSISAYLNRTPTGGGYAIDGAIYTDNAGAPNALVLNSAIQISSNITRNVPQWYSVSYVTKPSLSPNTPYWLGILATKDSVTYYDTGASNQEAMNADTLPFDDPFGSPTYHAHAESVYVSYTPVAQDRRGQVSWAELEVPDAARRGQVSWAELETPDAPRRGQISWTELEVPDVSADRRGQVSWAEFEIPNAPRRGQLSWVELETPDQPRRGQLSWGELEVPNAPRRGQISWSEFEVPNAPPTYVSYAPTFLWTAANWGTVSIYFEVYMRATTGTVYGRLIDSNDAEVTNSELSTTATTFQRLRSASSISFTNALSYRAQFGKAGINAGEFLGARIIIIPV